MGVIYTHIVYVIGYVMFMVVYTFNVNCIQAVICVVVLTLHVVVYTCNTCYRF